MEVCQAYNGSKRTAEPVQGWAAATANALDSSVDPEIIKALETLVSGLEMAFYALPEDEQPTEIRSKISDFVKAMERLNWSPVQERALD